MRLNQCISKLKVGKFLIHDSELVFEEQITGVLKKLNLETKLITLFDAYCLKEIDLPVTACGLCYGTNNTLLHSWGGKLRVYALNSPFHREVALYNKAYLCKARAILLSDTDDESIMKFYPENYGARASQKIFCEHSGFFYCADSSNLTRVSKLGKSESLILGFTIVCMHSCKETQRFLVCDSEGRLHHIDFTDDFFSPTITCLMREDFRFEHPRQILQHKAQIYVLDSRGIWIMGTQKCIRLPHVLHFAISPNPEKFEIICSEFNKIFRVSCHL